MDRTSVKVLIRDFDEDRLRDRERRLDALAHATVAGIPARPSRSRSKSIPQHARGAPASSGGGGLRPQAIERVGLAVRLKPIRGGTDGARLSFMGLPTPNLFAGEHNFHSRLEWVSAQDMDRAVAVIVELCRVWEERGHLRPFESRRGKTIEVELAVLDGLPFCIQEPERLLEDDWRRLVSGRGCVENVQPILV